MKNTIDGPETDLTLYDQSEEDEKEARQIYKQSFGVEAPLSATYREVLMAIQFEEVIK